MGFDLCSVPGTCSTHVLCGVWKICRRCLIPALLPTVPVSEDRTALVFVSMHSRLFRCSNPSACTARRQSLENQAAGREGVNPYEVYIPNLFRHPITGYELVCSTRLLADVHAAQRTTDCHSNANRVGSGEVVSVTVSYQEPLQYIDGRYHFTLPLRFGGNLLPDNKLVSDVVSIRATVNTIVPNINVRASFVMYHRLNVF